MGACADVFREQKRIIIENMRALLLSCVGLLFATTIFALPVLATPTISFVSGSCTGGLTCVFSINSTENSHVGECGYFGTSVCVNFTSATIRENACQAGTETGLLSLYHRNNTHVGAFGATSYQNHTCVAPTIGVTVKGTCGSGETCLISLNSTNNSHVGDCNYYGLKLCLGAPDIVAPTITVQSPQNTTYFTAHQTLWANVTINEIAGSVFRRADGESNVSLTNSSGNWNGQITGLSSGPHSVTFYANDTSNNQATPQTVYFVVDTEIFSVTALSPSNTTYRDNSILARVSTNRAADWCGRSLNGGANTTMTAVGADPSTLWEQTMTLDEGLYNVVFYCNDTGGNMNVSSTIYFTVDYDTIIITGRSLYLATGSGISSGNVTATILETGESNSTRITSANWDISLTSPTAFRERATIVIFINDTAGKSGYYTLFAGEGGSPTPPTACTNKAWRFSGTVMDSSTSSLSTSGTVRVIIENTAYSNSTSYSNGIWDVRVTPCLVRGSTFNANIQLIDSGGKRGSLTVRQVVP